MLWEAVLLGWEKKQAKELCFSAIDVHTTSQAPLPALSIEIKVSTREGKKVAVFVC